MTSVYVNTQGAQVRSRRRRLLVETGPASVESVRVREIERVALSGHVNITSSALHLLLQEGVETVLLTRSGKLLGTLRPPGARNVFRRLAQFRRHEDLPFRLGFGRTVVRGKIRNSKRLLQLVGRRDRETVAPALEALGRAEARVDQAESLPALMGVEGDAAATYFGAYGQLFLKELRFDVRSRRPPRDPVNALLSFGYTMLTGEAVGAVASHGLDPDVGFLHEASYGRPSLALDLVEEFRQPVVDRFVLSLANRGVLGADDFQGVEGGGVHLNDAARGLFFSLYERLMTREFQDASGQPATYRSLLADQAGRIARCVDEDSPYVPYRLP